MQKELRKQINNLHLRIKDAADNSLSKSNDITIIAVSKKKTFDHIKCAYDIGVRNFGENYAQELEEKTKHLRLENIIWHFIGPLQSNKAKSIAANAHWIHSLDRFFGALV